jgi:hypothetical protein
MESEWKKTLERVIPGIVVIRVCNVRAFDGSGASFSYATGFVVDAKAGIILTNRHVVTPGPVKADAVFINKEEVDLRPIYRDPGAFEYPPAAAAATAAAAAAPRTRLTHPDPRTPPQSTTSGSTSSTLRPSSLWR